jgi:hypothetical protein
VIGAGCGDLDDASRDRCAGVIAHWAEDDDVSNGDNYADVISTGVVTKLSSTFSA